MLSLRAYNKTKVEATLRQLPKDKQIKVYFASWPTNESYESSTHIEYLERTVKPFFTELLAKFPKAHVVSLGTCLEYGLKEGALVESTKPEPTTQLGAAKVATYKFLKANTVSGGLIHLRIFYPYCYENPRQGSLLWHLQNAINSEGNVFKMSHGNQMRDFISYAQITSQLYNILTFNKIYPVDILNIGTGKATKVIDLVTDYLSYHRITLPIQRGHYPIPSYEANVFYSAHDPIAREFLKCLA